ncbi:MAG: PepSY-like domain-containing protein, partial [Alistipes sp.]|nr:PepSY-like domain-containing protein [Alistipes sp.]
IATLAVTPTMAEDVAITAKKLPEAAQKFLKANFAQNKVVSAMHDKDVSDNDYTVILDNGTKIEFDASGKWESVKNQAGKIPAGIVPTKIAGYVAEHFSGARIEKIERKRYGYEVELTNGLDVKFGSDGRFIGIDD